ncbi:SlyX family protein [Stappia stellulata]|uniref:SlyX family protein n=1 Tax=Stappia stellulata TaxID=71235 RepID=UPI0004003902|nr:SlyX family protein [Stappia stellulata]
MDSDTLARIDRLEEQIAHQSHTIDELNEVVSRQADLIDGLTRKIAALTCQVEDLEDASIPQPAITKPPHY